MRLRYTTQFKRDWKRYRRSGVDLVPATEAVRFLLEGQALPVRFRDHQLSGPYKPRRECHVAPDWLLVNKREGDEIILERMGSHSELFD